MAKTVTLTVNVDDAQFKAFVTMFNDFSTKVQQLTGLFNQTTQSIQAATKASQQLSNAVSSTFQSMKSMGKTASHITDHIGKWATLIGGIGMMLGTGAGFFGIDRLAKNLLNQRKTALSLGMGTDLAGAQASQIALTGTPGSDQFRTSIAQAKFGNIEMGRTASLLGIPFGSKMSQPEMQDRALQTLEKEMKPIPAERLLQWAHVRGFDKFFGEGFLMAHKEDPSMFARERDDIKKRPADMDKKALDTWQRFSQAVARFTTDLENRLGEKLVGVATSLTHLSEATDKLIQILLDSPFVKMVFDKLAKWINDLATFLEKGETIEALKKFGSFVADVLTLAFKGLRLEFDIITGSIKGVAAGIVWIYEKIKALFPGSSSMVVVPGSNKTPSNSDFAIAPPPAQHVEGFVGFLPGLRSGSAGRAGTPQAFMGPASRMFLTGGAGGGGAGRSIGSGGNGGGTRFVSLGGRSGGGGSRGFGRGSSFSLAAHRAVPGEDARGLALGILPMMMGEHGGHRSMGALDHNNWQMNRTSHLVVRDVPSSNIFMSATGMIG